MTILTVKIPDSKAPDVSTYVKKIGGEIINEKLKAKDEVEEDDEVTHGVFFGENIKRVLKAIRG